MATFRSPAVLGLVVALFGIQQPTQDTNPIVGTWVLNVAKSTFTPGTTPRRESLIYVLEEEKTRMSARGRAEPGTYMSVRQEIKASANGLDGEGSAFARQWTVVYDGKDRPVAGDPNVEMMSLKRVDPFTVDASGQVVRDIAVFERQ